MDPDDLIAFARRDWAMVGESKSRFWLERKRHLSLTELLAVGDELRRHAMTVRPDWPTAAERAADVAIHLRVSEALRAVPARPR